MERQIRQYSKGSFTVKLKGDQLIYSNGDNIISIYDLVENTLEINEDHISNTEELTKDRSDKVLDQKQHIADTLVVMPSIADNFPFLRE